MDDKELRFKHYNLLVETYRHHFDLFIRGVGLYLLIISAFAGFMFSKESTANPNRIIIFVLLITFVAIGGLFPCRRWVKSMESQISAYEEELDLRPLSLKGALGILYAIGIAMIVVFIVGILLLMSQSQNGIAA